MNKLNAFLSNRFSAVKSILHSGLIVMACGVILLSAASPAMAAFGNSNSSASDGVEQLDRIQQRSEEAISKAKPGENADEMINRAEKGLNSIQGRADRSKMNSRGEARSAKTIEGSVEDALEEVTQ